MVFGSCSAWNEELHVVSPELWCPRNSGWSGMARFFQISIRFHRTHGGGPFVFRAETTYGTLTDEPAKLSAKGWDFVRGSRHPTQAPPFVGINCPPRARSTQPWISREPVLLQVPSSRGIMFHRGKGPSSLATGPTMPSISYRRWIKTQAAALDQMEHAHSSVGGTGRGRRYATDQINHAYAILLASQFQGFCRDLHSESAAYLIDALEPPSMRPIVRAELTRDRKLDKGNANVR